jgi:hypothetical protein
MVQLVNVMWKVSTVLLKDADQRVRACVRACLCVCVCV